jgi:predicted nucleic acid-binding protein
MTVIDSSSWIEMLRPGGSAEVRQRVVEHLRTGEARLVPMVRLELWNGARGEKEKKALKEFEEALPELEVNAEVWDEACELAKRARAAGLTVPATDLLIAACANHHGAAIEAVDSHFAELAQI